LLAAHQKEYIPGEPRKESKSVRIPEVLSRKSPELLEKLL